MSILSVDNISPIGSGTSVTVNNAATLVVNNANSSGVVTATTFSGSGASLTNLPAGQLTGTVADARITALTASKLTGALPAIDGSNLTGISAGGGAMTFISTTELTSAASSVIFTGLSNTYPVYKLFYNFVRSSTTSQYIMWRGAISGSAVNNIYSHLNILTDSSGQNYGNAYTGCLFSDNSGLLASGELNFYNIGESNTPITAHGHSLIGDRASGIYMFNSVHAGMGEAQSGAWNGIQITTFFDLLPVVAKFSLYGIKAS